MLRQVTLELTTGNEIQSIARDANVRLTLKDCRDLDDDNMTMLLELEGERPSLLRAVQALRKSAGMKQFHETKVSGTKTLCVAVLERPPVCSASMGIGVVCLRCPYSDGGETMTWQILVRRPGDIRTIIKRLGERGVGAKVASISEVDQEEILTHRQREVITMAISSGYFDFPRKVGLTELSTKLGIKPSTLSEIIRAAERKIMDNVTNASNSWARK